MSQSASACKSGFMSWPQPRENWEGTVEMDKNPLCSLYEHALPNRAVRWAELHRRPKWQTGDHSVDALTQKLKPKEPPQNFSTESFSHPLELICSAKIGVWVETFLLSSISLACIPWSACTISTGITEEDQRSSLTPLRKKSHFRSVLKNFCVQSQSSQQCGRGYSHEANHLNHDNIRFPAAEKTKQVLTLHISLFHTCLSKILSQSFSHPTAWSPSQP